MNQIPIHYSLRLGVFARDHLRRHGVLAAWLAALCLAVPVRAADPPAASGASDDFALMLLQFAAETGDTAKAREVGAAVGPSFAGTDTTIFDATLKALETDAWNGALSRAEARLAAFGVPGLHSAVTGLADGSAFADWITATRPNAPFAEALEWTRRLLAWFPDCPRVPDLQRRLLANLLSRVKPASISASVPAARQLTAAFPNTPLFAGLDQQLATIAARDLERRKLDSDATDHIAKARQELREFEADKVPKNFFELRQLGKLTKAESERIEHARAEIEQRVEAARQELRRAQALPSAEEHLSLLRSERLGRPAQPTTEPPKP